MKIPITRSSFKIQPLTDAATTSVKDDNKMTGQRDKTGPISANASSVTRGDEVDLGVDKPTTQYPVKRQKLEGSTLSSISSYIVTVNSDAKYGIGELLQLTTSPGGERAEIYSSHFCLGKLLESKEEVRGALRAGLRKKTHQGEDKDLDQTRKLWEALNNPPTQQQGTNSNS